LGLVDEWFGVVRLNGSVDSLGVGNQFLDGWDSLLDGLLLLD